MTKMELSIGQFTTGDGKPRFTVSLNGTTIRTVATRRGAETIIRNLRREEAAEATYDESLQQRLAASASRVLGFDVAFVRWERDRFGADVPVFRVPDAHYRDAVASGLRIDNTRREGIAARIGVEKTDDRDILDARIIDR